MDKDFKAKAVQLKQTKEFSQCLKSIGSLISLLKNDRFWAEYSLLIKMTPKIAIRLRNSPYSRSLEQLSKVFTKFKNAIETKSPLNEMKLFFESDFANETLDKVQTTAKEFISQHQSLAQKLFMMATLSQKTFRLSQVWLELGQLVNHFLMVSCVASRICIFSKTLLVYLYDVYQVTNMVYNLSDQHADTACDKLKPLLLKLNIKLKQNSASEKHSKGDVTKKSSSTATRKSDFIVDDEIVKSSVDLGVPLQRKAKQQPKQQPVKKKNNKKKQRGKKQSAK